MNHQLPSFFPMLPQRPRFFSLLASSLPSALMLTLAMPGLCGWWPLLFIALVPLLLFCQRQAPQTAAISGLIAGFLYQCASLYWILIVLVVYGEISVWLSVSALLLVAGYMSIYMSFFCALFAAICRRFTCANGSYSPCTLFLLMLAAPVMWVSLDYLRGFLLTGFPWMDLGYGLYAKPTLLLAADLGGHHLLTFSLILTNVLISSCFLLRAQVQRRRAHLLILGSGAAFVLVIFFVYPHWRAPLVEAELQNAPQAKIAVVQGNVDQAVKWSEDMKEETVAKYLRLSQQALAEKPTMLVWPETALPFYPQQDPLVQAISRFAAETQASLLTGAPLFNIDRSDGTNEVQYFNGALLFGPSGKVTASHAKQHLVPFGEYVPLRQFLPFLEPLVENVGDFTPGQESGPMSAGDLRLGVLICYESIFPVIARDSVYHGANALVNLTNDAWFGRSSAAEQSLSMAVLRAIENRRFLVRSANTGFSGFVDPLGHITGKTMLFTEGTFTKTIYLLNSQSFFTRFGYHFGPLCFFLSFFLVALVFIKKKRG